MDDDDGKEGEISEDNDNDYDDNDNKGQTHSV